MTIQARYSGVCPDCGERWQPGEFIRADEGREWKHATCPDTAPQTTHPTCEVCWLQHPAGACDR